MAIPLIIGGVRIATPIAKAYLKKSKSKWFPKGGTMTKEQALSQHKFEEALQGVVKSFHKATNTVSKIKPPKPKKSNVIKFPKYK
jgi:hypothetical protein